MMTNQTLSYDGYLGSVEFCLDEKVLHGQILFIRDLVTYEAPTIEQLEKEFELAVNDYVQDCLELGREPCKPFKGSFNIRTTPEMHKRAAMEAAKSGLNLNQYVTEAIQEKLDGGKITIESHKHEHNHYHEHQIELNTPESAFSWGDAPAAKSKPNLKLMVGGVH